MDIIHVASELAPVAKVGGLGDVLHGLCRALIAKKEDVEIILPKYDSLDLERIEHLEVIQKEFPCSFGEKLYSNTLWRGVVDGIRVTFIESHDPQTFFSRGQIYGCKDDISRFTYFCRAAFEYIRQKSPDIVHTHDWHTALLVPLLHEIGIKTIFTIHNLAYQGICDAEALERAGFLNQKLKEGKSYNLLKGGIIFADHVTTVSPNYAKEILSPELGGNLQPTLKKYQKKLSGVLNGIDFTYWNPETDPYLPVHFSSKKMDGKKEIKRELRSRFFLSQEEAPIVGSILRLVPQKGPELIKAALLRTLEWGGQFVLLGSALDEETHQHFLNLKHALAECRHVHLELTYSEELSHLVYAASDLFLVPSIFEPCGLTQMIAMRYGSVPLVRETGGLVDTVFEERNGFSFGPPTAEAINQTLDRALTIWNQEPKKWQTLIKNGMKEDYSWNKPSEEYLKIYRSSCLSLR